MALAFLLNGFYTCQFVRSISQAVGSVSPGLAHELPSPGYARRTSGTNAMSMEAERSVGPIGSLLGSKEVTKGVGFLSGVKEMF